MKLNHWIAKTFFGDFIEQQVAAAISVRVDDSAGWISSTGSPIDQDAAMRIQDIEAALEAWRHNFMIRRIVTLTHSYVIADGISLSSPVPEVETFIRAFWDHPKNHLDTRLIPMCDELTRTGELFPILFTNKVDGMSYLRFSPASQILTINTAKNDYEHELSYTERGLARKTWYSPESKRSHITQRKTGLHVPPVMLHYTVNQPIGATRGESDLTPILPWAKRYSEWLKDRVRLNRERTRRGVLHVIVKDETKVAAVRARLQTSNPLETGIYVSGDGEEVKMHSLNINATDAKEDGRALRLAIATGAQVGMHFLGEGESINYATAKEMGEPTTRFYTGRQNAFVGFLIDLLAHAYTRHAAITNTAIPSDLSKQIVPAVGEVARADNESLATAANTIVTALAQMKAAGWITDEEAIRIAYKFAGEPLGKSRIDAILGGAHAQQ